MEHGEKVSPMHNQRPNPREGEDRVKEVFVQNLQKTPRHRNGRNLYSLKSTNTKNFSKHFMHT